MPAHAVSTCAYIHTSYILSTSKLQDRESVFGFVSTLRISCIPTDNVTMPASVNQRHTGTLVIFPHQTGWNMSFCHRSYVFLCRSQRSQSAARSVSLLLSADKFSRETKIAECGCQQLLGNKLHVAVNEKYLQMELFWFGLHPTTKPNKPQKSFVQRANHCAAVI